MSARADVRQHAYMTDRHRADDAAPTRISTTASGGLVLTSGGAQLIAAEVARLRALREGEFAARRRDSLAVSSTDGDAHLAIGEEQLVADARIAALETVLRQATIVEHAPAGENIVGIGSTVTLEDVTTGKATTYDVVAWHDGVQVGTVSAVSPVGQAILGRAVGEELVIELPRGRTRHLRIAAVESPSQIAA